jgi:predicted ester cyclase
MGGCSPKTEESFMSTDQEIQNKEVVRRYWEEKWNVRSPTVLDDLQSPDVLYHGPSHEMSGIAEYKEAYGLYLSAFQDTKVTVEDLVASGDRVVSRVHMTGVHTGPLPDLPPTGKAFSMGMITVFRLHRRGEHHPRMMVSNVG